MKRIVQIILIVLTVAFIFSGCGKDEPAGEGQLNGKVVNSSDCKDNLKSAGDPDNLSCADYSFDEQNSLLKIKHINAGFNCCPKKLYCDVWLSNDTIYVQEFEEAALCRCNCLYDLDIEIKGVNPQKYQVKFIEPYAEKQNKLVFEIDLNRKKTGKVCVKRNGYPWGLSGI
jgi:hypothetical protein